MIWREKRLLLIVLGVLLAANVVYFFTYRVGYQGQLDALDARLEATENQLERAQVARIRAERTLDGYRGIERDVKTVFEKHWATQDERLTRMIAEVKRLALASSLEPQTYGFSRATATAASTRRRRAAPIGATEVSIDFTVTGTYEQVRRLINLLELSQQFVIIESISLAGHEGKGLTLGLHLKTLFRDEALAPAASNRL